MSDCHACVAALLQSVLDAAAAPPQLAAAPSQQLPPPELPQAPEAAAAAEAAKAAAAAAAARAAYEQDQVGAPDTREGVTCGPGHHVKTVLLSKGLQGMA